MSGPALSMVIDAVMIVLLLATVLFAARLALHLKKFNAGRKDLDRLVRDLGSQIEKAEKAIGGLRATARESGRDLQTLINQAIAISEELQLMEEAGDNMASRLEKLAEKNGKIAAVAPKGTAGFSIRDPEFEKGETGSEAFDDEDEESTADSGFQSRAEKELYEALRSGGRKAGAGRVS